MQEALSALAATMQQVISDILLDMAAAAAKAGDYISAALLLVGAVIVRVAGAISDLITGMGNVKRAIEENFEDLAIMFEEVGASMHATIEAAEADIVRLIESTADVETSTREKLIAELDQYYDYRNLKEMELAELMELAEETKRRIQEEGLEAVLQGIESEEEAQERKNDQAVEGLDAITEAYQRELEMIARKIILFKIEILLLRAKGEAEWGNKVAAKKYREEAQKMMEDLQAEIEATTAALEKETKAHKEGGEQTKKSEKEKQEAIKETKEAVEDLGETTVESMDKTAEKMVSAIQSMTQGIVAAIQNMSNQIVAAINSMVNEMNAKLGEIPDKIDFDVIGNLRMPEIPSVSPQWFNITGRYQVPEIPSYHEGIDRVPRTTLAWVQEDEGIFPKEVMDWLRGTLGRSGQMAITPKIGTDSLAASSGGITVNVPRGAVVVYGDIRTKADVEELREELGRDLGEGIGKQLLRTVPL